MSLPNVLLLLAFASSALAITAEYVPRSFYVIEEDGHQSDVVYLRNKRDIQLLPNTLLRLKRGGGSSASSHASASASSSSSSNSGGGGFGGGDGPYFGGNGYNPGLVDPGFNQGHFGNGGGGAQSSSFASSSSSSSSGTPNGGYGGPGGVGNTGYNGPTLFSRFGEATGDGVKVSGSAQGQKGAFSSSSSSIDGDGKIHYSVQSGKY